jgi:O-antigen ligase
VHAFYFFVFLYFFTLAGDLLNIQVSLFKVKLNNVVAVCLLLILLCGKRLLVLHRDILIAFLWILSSLLLSAAGSLHKMRCLGYVAVYFFEFINYFILPFNLVYQLSERAVFKIYFCSYVCVGVYAASQFVLSIAGIRDPFVGQWIGPLARPHAFVYEPSYYALYMCAFVMFYNALYVFERRSIRGSGNVVRLVAVNVLLILSTSTGAFFAYAFFFCAAFFFRLLRRVRQHVTHFGKKLFKVFYVLFSVFSVIAVVFTAFFLTYFFKFFTGNFSDHGSFATRWEGIENCWHLFLQHPFLGVGLGGVGPYLYAEHYGIADPDVIRRLTLSEIEKFDPTNALTEILGSLGLYGACAFAFLVARFAQLFNRTMALPALSPEKRAFALSLMLSLVVVVLVLQFNQGLFRNYLWAHAAMTYAYLLRCTREVACA